MSFRAPFARRLADPDSEVVRRSHEEAIRELQRSARALAASIQILEEEIASGGGGGGGGGGVPTTRLINTTAPLAGGGDLSADRTLTIADNSIASKGVVAIAPNDATRFWNGTANWSVPPDTLAPAEFLYGIGTDGNLTYDGAATVLGAVPSANVYTLLADVVALDLTLNVGITIKTNGFRIFVAGTLTLNGTIERNGINGGNAVGSVVGAAGGALGAGYFGATITGAAGNSGSPSGSSTAAPYGFSTTTTAGSGLNHAGFNGLTGQGGSGGASGQGTGGTASLGSVPPGTVTLQTSANGRLIDVPPSCFTGRSTSAALFTYGPGGTGGRSGSVSGSGVATDPGGGGGGGGGAGMLLVAARICTGSGSITAIGGRGGNGGNAFANNAGGGGGGGGGAGGIAVVIIGRGTFPTVSVLGGAGGNAGAPHGTGGTGYAGGNGGSGLALAFQVSQ